MHAVVQDDKVSKINKSYTWRTHLWHTSYNIHYTLHNTRMHVPANHTSRHPAPRDIPARRPIGPPGPTCAGSPTGARRRRRRRSPPAGHGPPRAGRIRSGGAGRGGGRRTIRPSGGTRRTVTMPAMIRRQMLLALPHRQGLQMGGHRYHRPRLPRPCWMQIDGKQDRSRRSNPRLWNRAGSQDGCGPGRYLLANFGVWSRRCGGQTDVIWPQQPRQRRQVLPRFRFQGMRQ